ncbi:hypothetical protein B0H63DRAFT_524261 [Podospora didyma]|uniref:Uncharacterized protein n=1 Tax=Podospora didyma TaxID=330526 RepID=A0AAE0NHE8_9PEZI|nr:hypothetical protein B0H63DRAFT_524261 [Podospora didyma]
MEVITPATPSPGGTSEIRTPSAPRNGTFEDSWSPYQPRKSLRIEKQRAANRTPSPPGRLSSQHQTSLGSPHKKKKSTALNSNMTSPTHSPQKRRAPAMDSLRRASGTLATQGSARAASVFDLTSKNELPRGRTGASTSGGMLITPAKTPQKPPTENSKVKIGAIARNLFHSDDEFMPAPTKTRAERYTLDSFCSVHETNSDVEIYTDSHERIPEVDLSNDNPFYGNHAPAPESPRRRSKRQEAKVHIPGEGETTVDEAVRRSDGVLANFRGMRKFRKFAVNDDSRANVTPRLLFPPKAEEQAQVNTDIEEAETDIEDAEMTTDNDDPVFSSKDEAGIATPSDLLMKSPGTPKAPLFAPASPPTTARTTRFGSKKSTETTPMKPRASKRSPFGDWRITKGSSDGHSHKRPAETVPEAPSKRSRA